jgi:hypothetical protein
MAQYNNIIVLWDSFRKIPIPMNHFQTLQYSNIRDSKNAIPTIPVIALYNIFLMYCFVPCQFETN